MTSLAIAFVLSFAASLALERTPPSLASFRAPWRATAIRLLVHVGLFAAAFALSWRPWHAAFVTSAVAFVFGAGNAMKIRILGEPLTFSDFALVRLAIKHPRLYYAEKLAEPRQVAIMLGLVAATTIWFVVEPSILPENGWPLLAVPPLVVTAVALILRSAAATKIAGDVVNKCGNKPGDTPVNADVDVARFGLGASMALHWLVWRRQERPSPAARAAIATAPSPRPAAEGPMILVAIQCESFVDVKSRGADGPDLPAYHALCREAVAWGRCRVPAEGAYTMRSEFGFLTGTPSDALGLDAFDPYLTAKDYAHASLGRRLRASGRKTVLIHPYDRRFFDRETLAPELGFERFVDGEAFSQARRFGPYVSDEAVADAVIAEAQRASEPTFLYVVTIENHGPWGPGRLPGCDDPTRQYYAHVENADRMIGRIADALRKIPGGAVLCAYGDHVPARTLLPALPDRGETDYVLWNSVTQPSPGARDDLPVDALGRLFLGQA